MSDLLLCPLNYQNFLCVRKKSEQKQCDRCAKQLSQHCVWINSLYCCIKIHDNAPFSSVFTEIIQGLLLQPTEEYLHIHLWTCQSVVWGGCLGSSEHFRVTVTVEWEENSFQIKKHRKIEEELWLILSRVQTDAVLTAVMKAPGNAPDFEGSRLQVHLGRFNLCWTLEDILEQATGAMCSFKYVCLHLWKALLNYYEIVTVDATPWGLIGTVGAQVHSIQKDVHFKRVFKLKVVACSSSWSQAAFVTQTYTMHVYTSTNRQQQFQTGRSLLYVFLHSHYVCYFSL